LFPGDIGQGTVSNDTSINPNDKLTECSKSISGVCTKLAVLFSKPPYPTVEECSKLCAELDQATLLFVRAYGLVKPDHGLCYRNDVKDCVLNVLGDLGQLLSTIMSEGCTR